MNTPYGGIALGQGATALAVSDPEEVFRQLSSRHVQTAYRLAWAILGDAPDAEDAVQDAFTSAWRRRTSLREADRFDAWFGRILINCCRDRLRQRARGPRSSAVMPEGVSPDHAPATAERDELATAMASLDEDQRIAVMLRFWLDMSVDDIAEKLGVPPGTVKSRLHRAMGKLRLALEGLR